MRRDSTRSVPLALVLSLPIGVISACTIDPATTAEESAIEVIGTIPGHLDTNVPRDALVSFFFAEPVDPGSLSTTPITVTSQQVRQSGAYRYDPIRRRLTYSPRGLLRGNLAYDATLSESLRGLRDGRRVTPASVTFVTGDYTVEPQEPPPVDFELAVMPLLRRSCAFSGCHAPPRAAASLDLSSAQGVASTAIASSSQGWRGWPRIDPGSAAWSYLLYKMLGEESIVGNPMPPGTALPIAEVTVVSRWIDDGAKVDPETAEP